MAWVIDTAGRYVEHYGETDSGTRTSRRVEEDRREWELFLETLVKYRGRSPINGLILTLKVPDILDPIKHQEMIEKLRPALEDIRKQLRIRVPVYVMVSMCDWVFGFKESCAELQAMADRTLLGWSRPFNEDNRLTLEETEAGLKQVQRVLENVRTELLANTADRSTDGWTIKRDMINVFPDEFAFMLKPLQEVLFQIFNVEKAGEQHFLRGVYFTSARQESDPTPKTCRELVPRRDTSLSHNFPLEKASDRKYFIYDFFMEKVFREQGLLRPTADEFRRRRWREVRLWLAGAVVLVLFAFTVVFGWQHLSSASKDTRSHLGDIIIDREGYRAGLDHIPSLVSRLIRLRDYTQEMRTGNRLIIQPHLNRVADKVDAAGLRLYVDHVLIPLIEKLTKESGGGFAETLARGRTIRELIIICQNPTDWLNNDAPAAWMAKKPENGDVDVAGRFKTSRGPALARHRIGTCGCALLLAWRIQATCRVIRKDSSRR